tara:strand:+ start:20835 stop:21455 length:621 start_codon:yes stop_codon:yes gene_type:complete
MLIKRIGIIFFFFTFCWQTCLASIERPEVMLERITTDMISALKKNDQILKKDPNRVVEIIDKILVPYMDSASMAKWVAGRNAWRKASPSQRARFTSEFRDLLIRTYGATLLEYKNQKVEYLPLRGSLDGKKRVLVSSLIREPGKESLKLTYRLVAKPDRWKVYDISIEGVSLLKGFKSQFSQELERTDMDKVSAKLQEYNKKEITR